MNSSVCRAWVSLKEATSIPGELSPSISGTRRDGFLRECNDSAQFGLRTAQVLLLLRLLSHSAEALSVLSRNGYCRPPDRIGSDCTEIAVCSVFSKGCGRFKVCALAQRQPICLLAKGRISRCSEQERTMPMTAYTKLLPTPPVTPEARSESRSSASTTEPRVAGAAVYWGDRLTLIFWLFCFVLMLTMQLVEALHRLVLLLLGRCPTH